MYTPLDNSEPAQACKHFAARVGMLHPSKEDFPVDRSLPTHVTAHDADDRSVELYLAWDLAKWFEPLYTQKIPPIQEGDMY